MPPQPEKTSTAVMTGWSPSLMGRCLERRKRWSSAHRSHSAPGMHLVSPNDDLAVNSPLTLQQRRDHLFELLDAHAALHHLAVNEQRRRGLHFIVLGAALAHREDVVIELLVLQALVERRLGEARLLANLQQLRQW